jgi:hypothetical protein
LAEIERASIRLSDVAHRIRLSAVVTLLPLCCGVQVRAEVYQYAAPAKDVSGRDITAFLWVPPEADRLRGVLLGGQTLMEPEFAKDPLIRQACAAEQLAIVFFSPPLDATFQYQEKNSGTALQAVLERLAEVSGYRELAVAPWFPFGHSVGSIFATRVVCWKPDRCFGALSFKGGLPMPANDPPASVAGVPMLVIKGQFEEFGSGPRADAGRTSSPRPSTRNSSPTSTTTPSGSCSKHPGSADAGRRNPCTLRRGTSTARTPAGCSRPRSPRARSGSAWCT